MTKIDWKKIDWNVWKPRLAYGGFAALCFVLALRWTFPTEAMRERLIVEAGTRGWQIELEDVTASGILGIRASGVNLEGNGGFSVRLDEVKTSLRLLPLLAGRRSIAFDAALYDGRVSGTADLGPAPHLVADVDGVDLAAAVALRKASGLELLGKLRGTADLTVPQAPGEKPAGRVDLTVEEAGLAGGQLPIPGMTSGLTLPRVGFGVVTANVKVGEGRATFEKLEAKGGDAELQTEGLYFVVQPRMEFAPIFGKAKVKVHDAFWSKGGAGAFRGVAESALASSKGPDGAWNFNVTGSVGHPRMQPVPPGR